MGSAKLTNAKPQPPMENKTIKAIKNFFSIKKERAKNKKTKETELTNERIENKPQKNDTVANILENFDKTCIKEEKRKEEELKQEKRKEESAVPENEDEFSDFAFKIIEDDRVRHSSEDSGFSEGNEVVKALEKLAIGEKKAKKTQTVLTPRGPDRSRTKNYNVAPYTIAQSDLDRNNQINQINRHALCGGQVIDNSAPEIHQYPSNEIDALKEAEQIIGKSNPTAEVHWDDILDIIESDTKNDDPLKDFQQIAEESFQTIDIVPNFTPEPNPIEEFAEMQNLPNHENSVELTSSILSFENMEAKLDYIYPTPPRSENVPSPMSESQTSFYPPNWENSLSPERSSPIYNSDYEKYQEIAPFEYSLESKEKKRERTSSLSSMTMKNFKDMQKEISNEFSKKECCQINRKSVKEVFDFHMGKLTAIERKNLCAGVAKMDLKSANGVLHHILLNLSSGKDHEDLQIALFILICQRVSGQNHKMFIGDFGLSLLKAAALRCPHRAVFTATVVHYAHAALRTERATADCVFHEVDAQGDNLIIACARGGDRYATVLAEITRDGGALPPLFRVHHANADGYTALHVACSQHSAASPRLHTIHVLLEHAGADLWKGDVKGGETALHLAVNSVNCDLRVIMIIFKQIERKLWKKLAHFHNLSSVTPLEYARSATKSTTRQNYPQEVFEFLKKCR